jgi:hypothetical protein
MWADFSYKQQNVIVKFSNTIENEEDYNLFIRKWMELYSNKNDFNFVFDTTNVGLVNMEYVFKMKKFIKKLKEFPRHYLKWSIIIVSNKYIRYILNMVFMFQKPVATVYIYNHEDTEPLDYTKLINDVINHNHDKFSIINP